MRLKEELSVKRQEERIANSKSKLRLSAIIKM